MKNKIIFLLTISVLILTSGCVDKIDDVLPLNERVEEVNGIYPTESDSYSQYIIIRGKVNDIKLLKDIDYRRCEDLWLITFDDKQELMIKGLECHSIMKGGINRIVIIQGSANQITYK